MARHIAKVGENLAEYIGQQADKEAEVDLKVRIWLNIIFDLRKQMLTLSWQGGRCRPQGKNQTEYIGKNKEEVDLKTKQAVYIGLIGQQADKGQNSTSR